MFDLHNIGIPLYNKSWGLMPFFTFLGINIPSYSFFVFLGLVSGVAMIFLLRDKDSKNENFIYIVMAGVIGGTFGAKLPLLIAYWSEISTSQASFQSALSGRTVVGGLIGGTISVIIMKKILGIKKRFGNTLVPGIIVGIAIGRVGCLMAGCCYGEATTLPWGTDFGDHIMRHPTQAYEIIYLSLLLSLYFKFRKKYTRDGLIFDAFLVLYFSYRFIIEFIRVEPKPFYSFSWYQVASLVVILYVVLKNIYLKNKKGELIA